MWFPDNEICISACFCFLFFSNEGFSEVGNAAPKCSKPSKKNIKLKNIMPPDEYLPSKKSQWQHRCLSIATWKMFNEAWINTYASIMMVIYVLGNCDCSFHSKVCSILVSLRLKWSLHAGQKLLSLAPICLAPPNPALTKSPPVKRHSAPYPRNFPS